MNLYPKEIQKYLEDHTKSRDGVLEDLDRRTHVEMLMPQMITGHVQGNFLSLLVGLCNANRILEIGSFTGYATICMARALPEDGKVVTLEKNKEFKNLANRFWKEAQVENKIEQHFGNALDLLKDLEGPFDIIYIDASKKDYRKFYKLCFPLLKIGGLLVADNVLWSGKVVYDPEESISHELDHFNKLIKEDDRVENVILPLRDGIHLARKISE